MESKTCDNITQSEQVTRKRLGDDSVLALRRRCSGFYASCKIGFVNCTLTPIKWHLHAVVLNPHIAYKKAARSMHCIDGIQ